MARGRHGPRLGAIGGFTTVEALVVIAVLGILAWIGLGLISIREKAFLVVMKADLRHIVTQQEPHAIDHYKYANDITDLSFKPSEGITVELLGEARGFTARTTHVGLPGVRCAVFMGTVSSIYGPATVSGAVSCDGMSGGGNGKSQQ